MKKRFTSVLLIFITTLVAVFIITRLLRKGGVAPEISSPPIIVSAPSKITPMPEIVISVSFDTTDVIPPALPAYEIGRISAESTEDLLKTLTKTLQIEATPSTLVRNDITIKSWLRVGEVELTHTRSEQGESVLYRRIRAGARPPPDRSQDSLVDDFVGLFRLPKTGVGLGAISSSSASLTGLLVLDTPAPKAFVTRTFAHKIRGYQIVDSAHNPLALSIMIDNFGIVRFSNYFFPPVIRNQLNNVVLIRQENIKNNIAQGRAGVINAANKDAPEWGERPSFSSLVIKRIHVVYAPKENLLLPAYILSCDGADSLGKQQAVSLFMWAVPE